MHRAPKKSGVVSNDGVVAYVCLWIYFGAVTDMGVFANESKRTYVAVFSDDCRGCYVSKFVDSFLVELHLVVLF